jgi:hypothetical protein
MLSCPRGYKKCDYFNFENLIAGEVIHAVIPAIDIRPASRNISNAFQAAPDAILSLANLTPSLKSPATPATTNNAAAFSNTNSNTGLNSSGTSFPDVNNLVNVAAFSDAVPPATAVSGCMPSPNCVGWRTVSTIFPSGVSDHAHVSPEQLISSRPSAPHTTIALVTPSSRNDCAKGNPSSRSVMPRSIPRGRAGLMSGPMLLKSVRKGRDLR